MSTSERRYNAREQAGWIGTYKLTGIVDPGANGNGNGRRRAKYETDEDGWAECRVLDFSPSGVGLELFGPIPRQPDEELTVRLELSGRLEGAGLELVGRVRDIAEGTSGYLRVGVEFLGLGPDEYSSLATLGLRALTY